MSNTVLSGKTIFRICLFVVVTSVIISIIYNERNKNTDNVYTDYYTQIRSQFKTPSFGVMNFFKSPSSAPKGEEPWSKAETIYEFTVKSLDNENVSLDKYKGKVILVVNVASHCGLTRKNYAELNELYQEYKDQGLAIVGFPCNQFASQEPGCEMDIKEFMKKNNVNWDMFAKIEVNGDNSQPLYKWLKSKESGFLTDAIKWNFTKFLINKQGVPVGRYAPTKNPKDISKDIKAELERTS